MVINIDIPVEKIRSPNQIGDYKIKFHQAFIKEWINNENSDIHFDMLWQCREACILALQGKT